MARRTVRSKLLEPPTVFEAAGEKFRHVLVEYEFPTVLEEHKVPPDEPDEPEEAAKPPPEPGRNPLRVGASEEVPRIRHANRLRGIPEADLVTVKLPRRIIKRLGNLPDDDRKMRAEIKAHGLAILTSLEAAQPENGGT